MGTPAAILTAQIRVAIAIASIIGVVTGFVLMATTSWANENLAVAASTLAFLLLLLAI
jgi:hypothetical protein